MVILESVSRQGNSHGSSSDRRRFRCNSTRFRFLRARCVPIALNLPIRELGDFTSTIGSVKIGTSAFVEGPYGAFVPDFDGNRGLVLVAGGVGIAPIMSIIRTLDDMKDRRRVILIYGSQNTEQTIFKEELLTLEKKLRLNVTFVTENANDSLTTESGQIRDDLLKRHLPPGSTADVEYFICGPGPMMDTVERYLHRAVIPPRLVHSERFDIA